MRRDDTRNGTSILVLTLCVLWGACAAARLPEAVTLPQAHVRPPSHVDQIHNYEGAVAAIAAVLERELGVAPFPVTFHFYPNAKAFEAALVGFGQDPAMARDTAAAMLGVGMHSRVLLNNESLAHISWPNRVRVLSHELIHSLQYELAGGIRGTSEQWLREGFAEWAALMVLDRLRGPSLRGLRDQQLGLLRGSDRSRAPRLDDMVDFKQWLAVANRRDIAPYAQAFLTVDFLVERHGAPAIVEYFRQFTSTRNYHLAFRRGFGEERAAFEAAVDERLQLRRDSRAPAMPAPLLTSMSPSRTSHLNSPW